MKKHLAIMSHSAIEAVLSGKKTIETRFSKKRIAPFGQISSGDLVYMKIPGGEILGQFRVKKVFFFENLEPDDIEELFKKYDQKLSVGEPEFDRKYQTEKKNSSFGTLIFVADSERFITSPIKIKKSDLRGWMVLS
ncbi:ASCH domain-containing protein [Candidatus Daviesbacteria bacterium]|nr:ASCH domain-containing protein [Candidatus Daviesbacteria bacterium]